MPARHLTLLVVATVLGVATWFARERDRIGRGVAEVFTLITTGYIEPVDEAKLFEAAIDGVVAGLDENSAFVRGDAQREQEEALDQRFGGVGLELELDEPSDEVVVSWPLPGGPAWRAGIVAGDRIGAIDGAATAGMSLREARARLRGLPGRPVTVTVLSAEGGAARDLRLVRELVEVDSVAGDRRRPDGSWDWWLEGEPGIAYLRLTGFGERTAAETDAVLAAVAVGQARVGGPPTPLRGIVIDLRGNRGGLVTAAVDVCDRFLEQGVIVSTRGRRAAARSRDDAPPLDVIHATPGAAVAGVPIAVLVDGDTASAAEILAACLQDHRRATIVGCRTFGKGTKQSLVPLSGGGFLSLTVAECFRPDGRPLHRWPDATASACWGVEPDDGFGIMPATESLDRLERWRRRRDVGPGLVVVGPPEPLPREVDAVLERALTVFSSGSGAGADLGGEEETARQADEPVPAGV